MFSYSHFIDTLNCILSFVKLKQIISNNNNNNIINNNNTNNNNNNNSRFRYE